MTIEQTRRGLRSARLTCCILDFATQPHMSKSAASIFTNLRLRMQKLVRSSATSTKTNLSGQHWSNSLRDRRPWSQRFPQRRPHKRCKPTGPAENCRTAHNVLGTTVLPTPNRSAAPQEQQRALAVSKQYPTRGFQSLERLERQFFFAGVSRARRLGFYSPALG